MMITEEWNDKPTGSNDGRNNEHDLIRRGDALAEIEKWWNCSQSTWQSPMTILRAIPAIEPQPNHRDAVIARMVCDVQQAFAYASNARPAGYELAIVKIEGILESALAAAKAVQHG